MESPVVRFARRVLGFGVAMALLLVHAELSGVRAATPDEASPEGRTMVDMRALATAMADYAIDNNQYPKTATMEALAELLSPTYIKDLPMTDAWQTPWKIVVPANQMNYTIVSAGSDRKFDESSWSVKGKTTNSAEDIVYRDGEFVRWYEAPKPAPGDRKNTKKGN